MYNPKNKKKGVFLIYVLFTAVLISIFLLTAVSNMHNTVFMTTKFTGENKAYWAAEAGLQYCKYKLKSDLAWPFSNSTSTGTEKFGEFNVTSSVENAGKGFYVHGVADKTEEEFNIYFSQKENDNDVDLVPSSFPASSKNLSYCSYNSITQEKLTTLKRSNIIKYSDIKYTVSHFPEYKTIVISPGIYIVSDGRCRGYKAVLENMLVADYGNTYGGGIYCGGNLSVILANQDNRFKVIQESNARPAVYCKKNVAIHRGSEWTNMPFFESTTQPTDNDDIFPCYLGNGTIYLSNLPYYFEFIQEQHTGKYHGTAPPITNYGNINKENETFKQKYGLHLEEYKKEEDDTRFPRITWSDIQSMKSTEKNIQQLDSGSYVAIYNGETLEYDLCWFPHDLLDKKGVLDTDYLDQAINKTTSSYKNPKNGSGTKKPTDAYKDLKSLLSNNTELIKQFVECCGGKIICNKNIKNDIFSIETITINKEDKTKTQTEKTTEENIIDFLEATKTPVITLKKSVNVNGNFNLLTLHLNTSEEDFECYVDKDVSTDLIFSSKNTGFNEECTLNVNNNEELSETRLFGGVTPYKRKRNADGTYTDVLVDETNSGDNSSEEGTEKGLIVGNVISLYSNGYTAINGKVSGTGQIISNESVYFRAGTPINSSDYNLDNNGHNVENTNIGEISKIAIYSRGSVKMDPPFGEAESDFDELHNKIAKLLANAQGKSVKELLNNTLYKEKTVSVNVKDLTRTRSDIKNGKYSSPTIVNEEKISLAKLMRKYYGFEDREARDYIQEIIEDNCNYDNNNHLFKMPSTSDSIKISSTKSASSFSGLIYACGGFTCNADRNNVIINGTIVTYGADPSSSNPGSGTGLNADNVFETSSGDIQVKKCKDFSIIYNSTDLTSFVNKYSSEKPVNLSDIYCNRL